MFLKRCRPKIFNSARWSLTCEKSRESLNPQRAQIKTLTEKKNFFFLFLPKSLSNCWQINKSELKKGMNYGERKVRLGTHKHRLLLLLRFELKYNSKCIIWNRKRFSNDYLAAKSWATAAAAACSLWLLGMNFPQFLAKTVVFSCSSSSSRTLSNSCLILPVPTLSWACPRFTSRQSLGKMLPPLHPGHNAEN